MSDDLADQQERRRYTPTQDAAPKSAPLVTSTHRNENRTRLLLESMSVPERWLRLRFSNRQIRLVESGLSYCKQTTVIGPNRQIFKERQFAEKASWPGPESCAFSEEK